MHIFSLLCVYLYLPFGIKTPSASNRVEAWTREVAFLLRQEGRPVADLVGNRSTDRVMTKDWNTTDSAVQWIRQKATALLQPFALYLGLNLPHPYRTEDLGPTAGGSTFRTSPYWLKKVGGSSSLIDGNTEYTFSTVIKFKESKFFYQIFIYFSFSICLFTVHKNFPGLRLKKKTKITWILRAVVEFCQ